MNEMYYCLGWFLAGLLDGYSCSYSYSILTCMEIDSQLTFVHHYFCSFGKGKPRRFEGSMQREHVERVCRDKPILVAPSFRTYGPAEYKINNIAFPSTYITPYIHWRTWTCRVYNRYYHIF